MHTKEFPVRCYPLDRSWVKLAGGDNRRAWLKVTGKVTSRSDFYCPMMVSKELDSVDKGILFLLQKDARRNTTEEMAEKVGVSSSTVANRISRLEERGVIIGYHPIIKYNETGLGHHLLVTATVPLQERERMLDDIMEVSGVVSIRELLTNNENLSMEVVGRTSEDIEDALEALDSLGVDIERMEMMKQERTNPYNHFGKEFAEEDLG